MGRGGEKAKAKKPMVKGRPSAMGSRLRYLAIVGAAVAALLGVQYARLGFPSAEHRLQRASADPEDVDVVVDVARHVREVRAEAQADLPCEDSAVDCVRWARSGECAKNEIYMLKSCRASCGECDAAQDARPSAGADGGADKCEDTHSMCTTWASIGECLTNPSFMNSSCPLTCRLCQSEACRDRRDDCSTRAERGGCYTLPGMRDECAWTCLSCKLAETTTCTRDRSSTPAATPGSVRVMFERIAEQRQYVDGRAHEFAVGVRSTSPWVITIDDFLSSDEADALLAAGGNSWARSLAGDGVQQVRTSSTSWCRGACLATPTVQDVQARIANLTGVPTENAEYIQTLRCALEGSCAPARGVAALTPSPSRGCVAAPACSSSKPRVLWPPRIVLDQSFGAGTSLGSSTASTMTRTRHARRRGARASTPSSCTSPTWRREAARASPSST
jgi:hypothetical protein